MSAFQDFGGYAGGGGGGDYDHGGYQPQGGFLQGSQGGGSGGEEKKSSTMSPYLCVTIRSVLSSQEGSDKSSIIIENKAFSRVIIMGKVVQIKVKETAKTVYIDDGTGVIQASIWASDDEPALLAAQRQGIQENVYVKCFGGVRRFNNEWSINSYQMAPIKDFNEITHHFLQCIFVRLQMVSLLLLAPLDVTKGRCFATCGTHVAQK